MGADQRRPEVTTGPDWGGFGEQSEWLLPGNTAPETKGWIGERYDADAGLQYLNARYYEPELSLFLQPDWFEVTKAGVGTNRFSYSFNDPVNKFDPGGNATEDEEEYPYTSSNGTKAHEVLVEYVEADESLLQKTELTGPSKGYLAVSLATQEIG